MDEDRREESPKDEDNKVEIIVRAPTIKDYIEIVSTALNHGLTWCDKSTDIDIDIWKYYKTDTCIILEDTGFWYSKLILITSQYSWMKISSKEDFIRYLLRDRVKNKYNLK